MFQKALRKNVKLKMALAGTSGTGKTYTALSIASGLGSKIALIDTEGGSSQMYADKFAFDIAIPKDCSPVTFKQMIESAIKLNYDVVIIDSLSHEWEGRGGVLQMVEEAEVVSRNSFSAWKVPSKLHQDLINTIINAPIHIICTLRAKTEYAINYDEKTRKNQVVKLGLKPIQRDNIEYEFDFYGRFVDVAQLYIEKSRISEYQNALLGVDSLSATLGTDLLQLLIIGSANEQTSNAVEQPKSEIQTKASGVKGVTKVEKSTVVTTTKKEQLGMLWETAKSKNITADEWKNLILNFGVTKSEDLSDEQINILESLIVNYTA